MSISVPINVNGSFFLEKAFKKSDLKKNNVY